MLRTVGARAGSLSRRYRNRGEAGVAPQLAPKLRGERCDEMDNGARLTPTAPVWNLI